MTGPQSSLQPSDVTSGLAHIRTEVRPPDVLYIEHTMEDGRISTERFDRSSVAASEMYRALRDERARVDEILDRNLYGEPYNRVMEQIERVQWLVGLDDPAPADAQDASLEGVWTGRGTARTERT